MEWLIGGLGCVVGFAAGYVTCLNQKRQNENADKN